MKIAVILGPFSVGPRPLDFHFNNIWESPRGLTGTDLATVMICQELAERNNDIHLFTLHSEPNNKPDIWGRVKIYNLDEAPTKIDDSFDAIISINEPNMFIGLPSKPIRICWQFLNDFDYCIPGVDSVVDKWLGVCQQHVDHLKGLNKTDPNKWGVLGLGCYPEWYKDERIPGRVVWCSSADRGLHWLLQIWPQIKAAVPYATLKIFYHFGFGQIEQVEPNDKTIKPHIVEMGQRIRYMKHAIEKLKPLGVEHIGGVNRITINKEFNEASVLGYTCDTVCFSEGFSVTTLEAHASFTVPLITDKDCFGTVYKNSGALMVKGSIKDNLQEYTDLMIKSLTDQQFANRVIDKCRVFAMQNTWVQIAEKMENVIKQGK